MDLLPEIEAFMEATAIPATLFGRKAVSDPRFVLDLRMGRTPRDYTVARTRAFMRDWGSKQYVPIPPQVSGQMRWQA